MKRRLIAVSLAFLLAIMIFVAALFPIWLIVWVVTGWEYYDVLEKMFDVVEEALENAL